MLAAHADAVKQYRAGKKQTYGFLVGQVIKSMGGKANPALVNTLVRRELDKEPGVIEAYHVSKTYARGVYALRDLSLRIDKGDFVFLTGPSGAGKSTLLRLLLRQDVPTEGQLMVGGRNLATLTPRQVQTLSPIAWLRLSGFQAAASEDRARERLVRAARARHGGIAAAAPHVPGAEVGRPAAPDECISARALRRRAAAHRDRARARQRSRDHSCRRADRQSRSGSVARNHEPVSRDQRARHDGGRRDARSGTDPARRPAFRDARSRPDCGGHVDARAQLFLRRKPSASLWRGRKAAILSILTIAGGLFVLGFFLVLNTNLQRLVGRWTESAELSVYLKDDATPEQLKVVDDLISRERACAEREYVSKAQAAARFKQDFPDLAGAADRMDSNPFPASFEVRLKPEVREAGGAVDNLASTLAGVQGVADVRYDRRWLTRLNAVVRLLRALGLGIVVLLAFASALTVANVVRLAAVRARRRN